MQTSHLVSYSRKELEALLGIMRNYKTYTLQAGSRAKLVDSKNQSVLFVRIEYPASFDQKTLHSFVESALPEYFPETKNKEYSIEYKESSYIVGGVRMFCGDEVVDISFQKFKSVFSK
jgi:hypothetical protein